MFNNNFNHVKKSCISDANALVLESSTKMQFLCYTCVLFQNVWYTHGL